MSKISQGEWKIIHILKNSKIKFEREKTFKDLRLGLLRYDFFLPDYNMIIEFNGEQHYKYNGHFFKGRQDFLGAQERDRRKISYALAHGIKIYIIPFWDYDKIEDFQDLIKQQYLATSRFHNDNAWRNYVKK